MKLKTLKDFEIRDYFSDKIDYDMDENMLIAKLRQEAIKWIREETRYLGDGEYQFKDSGMRFRWHDLLKHFFNIEERDLDET
jgi:hypothetical protein|tara:strand:+ start:321 stop:566 length:246 start_codon:yes stop_codon:yes gene_type:complete